MAIGPTASFAARTEQTVVVFAAQARHGVDSASRQILPYRPKLEYWKGFDGIAKLLPKIQSRPRRCSACCCSWPRANSPAGSSTHFSPQALAPISRFSEEKPNLPRVSLSDSDQAAPGTCSYPAISPPTCFLDRYISRERATRKADSGCHIIIENAC